MKPGMIVRLLAACMLISLASSADAEILLLRNGDRIHCRVLKETRTEVVIRDGQGRILTHRREDVAEILPDISHVDVFEAVAERHHDQAALMYYLGLYCKEHGISPERVFSAAAGDPWWRGRAMLAAVRSAGGNSSGRSMLMEALAVDPTIAGAAGDLSGLASLDVPARALIDLAAALEPLEREEGVEGRDYAGLAEALEKLGDEYPPDVLDRMNFRMEAEAGISARDIIERVNAVASAVRPDCVRCSRTGYIRCDACGGEMFIRCDGCSGTGFLVAKADGAQSARVSVGECPKCRGLGVYQCRSCVRQSTYVQMPRTVVAICRACGGETRHVCKTCAGSGVTKRYERNREYRIIYTNPCSACRGKKWITCEPCKGAGYFKAIRQVRTRLAASGYIPCPDCNARREIPLVSRAAMDEMRKAEDAPEEPPPGILRSGEIDALLRFRAEVNVQCKDEDAYALLSGANLPVKFAATPGAARDSGNAVFAAGKWVDPSAVQSVLEQEKVLGYRSRPMNSRWFAADLVRLQMEDLKSSAMETGTEPGAFWTLFRDIAGQSSTGELDQYDRMRIYRTEVPAGGLKVGDDGNVRMSALEDTDCWPARRVTFLASGAEGGASSQLMAEAMGMSPGSSVAVYYRVTSIAAARTGDLADAMETISASIRISAVSFGQTHVVEGLDLLTGEDDT